MANSKEVFNELMENFVGLDESASTIVRQLRKISSPASRRKIINELRNLENKRLELLDQMDDLGKST
jgi:hypothetical protein